MIGRGNTLFINETKMAMKSGGPEENTSPVNYQNAEEASADIQTEKQTRIIDDQSREVPGLFAQWKKEEGIGW